MKVTVNNLRVGMEFEIVKTLSLSPYRVYADGRIEFGHNMVDTEENPTLDTTLIITDTVHTYTMGDGEVSMGKTGPLVRFKLYMGDVEVDEYLSFWTNFKKATKLKEKEYESNS